MVATPQEMIRLNTPKAVGIVSVVLWVTVTNHDNPYMPEGPLTGLLHITEVGTGGQAMQGVFSRDGVHPFVSLGKHGASLRDVEFHVSASPVDPTGNV